MTNHNPSAQAQFLAALLAFTGLLYVNVLLMTRVPAAAPQHSTLPHPPRRTSQTGAKWK